MQTAVVEHPHRTVGRDRSLLKQRAYVELKRLILDAAFEPGEFLSERRLAERLNMSKTPIRAALERLECEGFLVVSPQQGIVVRDLAVHEIADQFEIRAALESHVVRSLAGKLNEPEQGRLRESLEDQRAAVSAGDHLQLARLDAEFHMMLCEFHGNREIIHVMAQLRDRVHRVIARVFAQDADRMAASVAEHAGIAEAVLTGTGEQAVECVREHLEYGRQFLLAPRRR